MKRTCKQCGKEFELLESEIGFYKSKGLELPKRCKSCREKNKGRGSQTEQKQKMVSTSQSSHNNRNYHDDHNRNDKSRVVVSVVAVLLVLLVFIIKSVFSIPSESTSVRDDVSSADIQSKSEVPKNALSEVPVEETALEAATSELQQTGRENSEQTGTEIPQQPEVSTQPETQNETPAEAETAAATATVGTVPETLDAAYRFRKPEYLTEHFQKHGAEFPYATEEEYLLGANKVIQNPNALHKLEAEDGDDVYYVESTREFVIVSTDGYIRTYFTAGLDYYNRQ